MTARWTPMRWPASWKEPALLALLKGTSIDYLLMDGASDLDPVRAAARRQGLQVAQPDDKIAGVALLKGEWPGVRMSRGGGASAGPTGAAWVDSNGWAIRLSGALNPEAAAWVNAPPPVNSRITAESYLIAIADAGAHGGRWIVSPDMALAAGLAASRPESIATWKKLTMAADFFAAHKEWAQYSPVAVVGVISDFTGANEFLSHELLNLLGRAGQHYHILPTGSLTPGSLAGLRALIYIDADAPDATVRQQVGAFVQNGGVLITVPAWGPVTGAPVKGSEHPRFTISSSGKGRIAVASSPPDDPYQMANDSVVLVSHRYDLVRFWNGGTTGSFYAASPDSRQAVAHLLFYANRGPDSASVRIAGPYRKVNAATVDQPQVPRVESVPQKDALEVHLPQVSQYVALELGI